MGPLGKALSSKVLGLMVWAASVVHFALVSSNLAPGLELQLGFEIFGSTYSFLRKLTHCGYTVVGKP